jgi:hypothetical protein
MILSFEINRYNNITLNDLVNEVTPCLLAVYIGAPTISASPKKHIEQYSLISIYLHIFDPSHTLPIQSIT